MWSCAAKLTPKWRRRQATPRDRGSSPGRGPPTAEELGAAGRRPAPPTFPGATPPRAARDADADASGTRSPPAAVALDAPALGARGRARCARSSRRSARAHAALREDMDRRAALAPGARGERAWSRGGAAAGGGAQAIEPPKPRPKTTLEQLLGITCGVRLACDDEGLGGPRGAAGVGLLRRRDDREAGRGACAWRPSPTRPIGRRAGRRPAARRRPARAARDRARF